MLITCPSLSDVPERLADLQADLGALTPVRTITGAHAAEQPHRDDNGVLIEFLDPPTGAAQFFAAVTSKLRHRLATCQEPLVMVFTPQAAAWAGPALQALDAEGNSATVRFAQDDTLALLVLSETVASSPLLPLFARKLEGRTVSDRQFAQLLEASFG